MGDGFLFYVMLVMVPYRLGAGWESGGQTITHQKVAMGWAGVGGKVVLGAGVQCVEGGGTGVVCAPLHVVMAAGEHTGVEGCRRPWGSQGWSSGRGEGVETPVMVILGPEDP